MSLAGGVSADSWPVTTASNETNHERTGSPERDIRHALALKVNEANTYYLTDHADLFPPQTAQAAAA